MSILRNEILLLKSQSVDAGGEDNYKTVLLQNKFEVQILQTIDFEYENLISLRNKLEHPENFSGIIFSSPRAVLACEKTGCGEIIKQKWRPKHNYVIGETTDSLVRVHLGLECKGKETGNAENLSNLIITEKDKFNAPFLYPCGNLSLGILQEKLEAAELKLEPLVVYKTITNPNLARDFQICTNNFSTLAEYIVFFSPSGVTSAAELLRKFPENIISKVKFIAIGPSSEKALRKHDFNVAITADHPTPGSLLNAVSSLVQTNSI